MELNGDKDKCGQAVNSERNPFITKSNLILESPATM